MGYLDASRLNKIEVGDNIGDAHTEKHVLAIGLRADISRPTTSDLCVFVCGG